MNDNQSIDTAHEAANQRGEVAVAGPLSETRRQLNELAQQLAHAAERKSVLAGKIDTMQRARQAAQADGTAAHQQWGAKLRDSDGTLTRDIQKLRANERSALSLADEYEAMSGAIAAELPRVELELAEAAHRCLSAANGVIKEASSQAYAQFMEQSGDRLAVAFALFCKAENAGVIHRQKIGTDELALRFFGRLGDAVSQRLGDAAVTHRVDQVLGLPPMDLSAVDMKLVGSPARRSHLQAQIRAGSAA